MKPIIAVIGTSHHAQLCSALAQHDLSGSIQVVETQAEAKNIKQDPFSNPALLYTIDSAGYCCDGAKTGRESRRERRRKTRKL